jgi:cohesin complex subunit SCC1
LYFVSDLESPESVDSESTAFSHFSLGATNAAVPLNDSKDKPEDDDDDDRQQAGEDVVLSTSKWHRNTEKVFGMLKRNMTVPNNTSTSTGADTKPSFLMFDSMSKGASRRTAAGVFFELLQLKTWDYIDLGQESSYGNIKISPGTKFTEDPPSG